MKEIVARARDDSNLTVEMPNEPVLAKRAGTQLGEVMFSQGHHAGRGKRAPRCAECEDLVSSILHAAILCLLGF